jgi:photosystem II stability/assembly factor-like uncharacterized protein
MKKQVTAWLRGAAFVLALAALASPTSAATLFGLIDTGELFSSADNGVTWSPLSTLPVRDATALAARLSSSDLYLVSHSGSVYRSMDAGVNWTAVGAVAASDLEDLSIKPDGTLLVLTSTGALYSSTDLGATFIPLAALTGSNFTSLTHTTAPAVNHYALTRTGEVYESLDGGTTWTPKGAIAVSNARRIRAVRSSLYVLTETGDIWKSTDAAVSWTAVGTLSQVGMRGLVWNGTSLAAASQEGHVATSADGIAWTWQGSMNQLTLTALASDEPATTGVESEPISGVFLGPPYPNPSSGVTSFVLRLERETEVSLVLIDVAGRLVAERSPQRYGVGSHVVAWDPKVVSTGLYFLKIETDSGMTATRRWVVLH